MDTSRLIPINGNILVRDDIKNEVTKGGIYIPDVDIPDTIIAGTVVDISNRKTDDGRIIESEVVPGNKIMYKFHAGAGNAWKSDDGTIVRMIRESEILARINDDEKDNKEQGS